jgi:hypothetical protein
MRLCFRRFADAHPDDHKPLIRPRARLPLLHREARPCRYRPSADSRYTFRPALSWKVSTAPFGSVGAFGLLLHWPLCGPDVYFGAYPAA